MLKKVIVEHVESSEYDILVESDTGAPDRVETFSNTTTGTLESGDLSSWCHGENDKTTITLRSRTASPCTWTTVAMHGDHITGLE